MLFGRREKPEFSERVRVFLWPRRGWHRSSKYVLKRLLRLSGTPHAIALGVAAGVFASFTPFIGFHFVIGAVVAWLIGGNLIASALGTFVGNPLTFPFIWASTFSIGNWILGIHESVALDFDFKQGMIGPSLEAFLPIFKPMLVSGVPLGIVAGLAFYFPMSWSINLYQQRRRQRIKHRIQGRTKKYDSVG
ncbi:MAG: DUF2062 domain-containing protein [Fimbriimonadaceae bacterium]|nr:DUF2062 domain-containing protein [Alphaproteobacteria bacterium]